MPRIAFVHGIGQEHQGPHVLAGTWIPAMKDGIALARRRWPGDVDEEAEDIDPSDVKAAFYGDLFRAEGRRATGIPYLEADDVNDDLEQELLYLLWQEAARLEPDAVQSPSERTRGRAPGFVQRALSALSHCRFFTGIVERSLIFSLKQVRLYLRDPNTNAKARKMVQECIGEDTRVVIGHSLARHSRNQITPNPL